MEFTTNECINTLKTYVWLNEPKGPNVAVRSMSLKLWSLPLYMYEYKNRIGCIICESKYNLFRRSISGEGEEVVSRTRTSRRNTFDEEKLETPFVIYVWRISVLYFLSFNQPARKYVFNTHNTES